MTETQNESLMRIAMVFDADPVAGEFLASDGDGGFAVAVFRMAREIERLRGSVLPAGRIPMPQNASEAEAMQKLGFSWLKVWAPERLTESGLNSPVPAVVVQGAANVLDEDDFNLLVRLRRANSALAPRKVIDRGRPLWSQGLRLSAAGLIAIHHHADGGIFHITDLGLRALEENGSPFETAQSDNPQMTNYTERYDGID